MPKIRVLIVDDAVVMRRLINEAIVRDSEIEVVGIAPHGRIALAKIPQVNPDVITLDVEMPEMDGVTTVREIRKLYPRLPVIMFSSLTERGAAKTFDALAAGATDYVTKPTSATNLETSLQKLEQELLPKIKLHARKASATTPPISVARPIPAAAAPATYPPPRLGGPHPIKLVCIGTSTGGPNALATVFSELTQPLPVPIVIVQHMPVLFTRMLAERLDKLGATRFSEGTDGQALQAGHAYLAPGGRHMEVTRTDSGLRLRIHDDPPENSCRPAVDVLFRSVARTCGGDVLATILTGMGQDGLNSCRTLRELHAQILAQDEASSVVWGMPGQVATAGLCDRILPLNLVAAEITRRVSGSRRMLSFARSPLS